MQSAKKHRTILGIRLSALIETVVFLSLLVVLNMLFGSGDRFVAMNPHPFWIIILLMTVQYGTAEGLMAAVLCTLFLYAGKIPQTQFDESLFEYRVRIASLPVLWFLTAIILGEIRGRISSERDRYKKIAESATAEAREISSTYELLKEKKEHLELKLSSEMRTLAITYHSLRNLESMNPGHILYSFHDLIKEIINPKKFSIYSYSDSGFEAMIHEGWSEKESYLRRFGMDDPLTKTLIAKKRVISVVNPKEEKVLQSQGIIAAPIFDKESGEIFGMLKIEEIAFADVNISNLEICQTLSELIGTTFSNAIKYTKLEKHSVYSDGDESSFSVHLYDLQKQYLKGLFERIRKPLSQIDICLDCNGSTPKQENACRAALLTILRLHMPKNSELFQTGRDDVHYTILAPLVTLEEASKKREELCKLVEKEPLLIGKKIIIDISSLATLEGVC